MNSASELEQKMEEFRIATSKSEEEEYENFKALQNTNSILLSAEESLKRKWKGQRISYHERVYLYKQMKASENSLIEIAMENNISMGTLYNISKEFDTPIKESALVKSTTSRNLVESPKLQNIVRAYLSSTKVPWSSKDIWAYIKVKTGLVIHSRVVRNILTEVLKMKY